MKKKSIYEIICWGAILALIVLSFIASYHKDTQSALLCLILATMIEGRLYTNSDKKDVNK